MTPWIVVFGAASFVLVVFDGFRALRVGALGDHSRILINAVRNLFLAFLAIGAAILSPWTHFWITLAVAHAFGCVAVSWVWRTSRGRELVVSGEVAARVCRQRQGAVLYDLFLAMMFALSWS